MVSSWYLYGLVRVVRIGNILCGMARMTFTGSLYCRIGSLYVALGL